MQKTLKNQKLRHHLIHPNLRQKFPRKHQEREEGKGSDTQRKGKEQSVLLTHLKNHLRRDMKSCHSL